jgi:hypothetical protein
LRFNTAWAADFETPLGSSTFLSFFSLAALAEINNKKSLQTGLSKSTVHTVN